MNLTKSREYLPSFPHITYDSYRKSIFSTPLQTIIILSNFGSASKHFTLYPFNLFLRVPLMRNSCHESLLLRHLPFCHIHFPHLFKLINSPLLSSSGFLSILSPFMTTLVSSFLYSSDFFI